ncbi:MAG: Rpo12/RPC10 RNA polymerase subunit family protein [Planctomycetota bacterium]
MAGYGPLAWVWWATGGAAALLGLAVLAVALFADRARGRRRCPRCWYDLSGTPGLQCPECGHAARRERALFRTRRPRRWIAVALALLAAGAGLALRPTIRRDGWLSLVPTRALLWTLPFADDPEGAIPQELLARMRGAAPRDGERRAFFRRIARGDPGARPVGPAWRAKYGELVTRWRRQVGGAWFQGGPYEGRAAEQALDALPVELRLRTRRHWPDGVPVWVDAACFTWWRQVSRPSVRVAPRLPGAAATVLFHDVPAGRGAPGFELPPLAPGEHVIAVDLEVSRQSGDDPAWHPVESRTAEVSVRVGGALEDLMTPVRDAALDELLVRRMFILVSDGGPDAPPHVSPDVSATTDPRFDGVAVAVRIEILLDDAVVGRAAAWWTGGVRGGRDLRTVAEPGGDLERLAEVEDGSRLRARVRSDPALALRVVDADRFWEGRADVRVEHAPLVMVRRARPRVDPRVDR